MKKQLSLALILTLPMIVTGCATITNDANQAVKIETNSS
jgi:hypothetical protein